MVAWPDLIQNKAQNWLTRNLKKDGVRISYLSDFQNTKSRFIIDFIDNFIIEELARLSRLSVPLPLCNIFLSNIPFNDKTKVKILN